MTGVLGYSEESDAALLRQALGDPEGAGGRRAASVLLSRYQRHVYVWCLRYVRDHERALELAQEVLMRAYLKLESFEGRSQLGSWLFMITRNHCLNEVKRPALLTEDSETDPDRFSANQPSPEDALIAKMREKELLDLIHEQLDRVEQRAVWLRCFEKMPVDAITKVLKIAAPSGARGVLQSARRKLRVALETGRG